ncbi:MAG: hypothetical protein M3Y56_01095 [Armatimonadota bacterium]|nr:hypothetical protein [Armatimonadota bacterium]
MRRVSTRRPASFDDLDAIDQQIYNSLTPELQREFLQRHPPVKDNPAARQKLVTSLNAQLQLIGPSIESLTTYRKSLERGVKEAQRSGNLSKVKGLLELPQTPGLEIRKTRTRRKRTPKMTDSATGNE